MCLFIVFLNLSDFISSVEHKKNILTNVFVYTIKVSGVQNNADL